MFVLPRLFPLFLLAAGYDVIEYKTGLQAVNISTLRLAQVIFRHGDRTPINPFPNDWHKDYWTIGYGELTNRGKQQHYALGQYVRGRYAGFLNESFWTDQVHVNSTDLDRTLESAASHLAGLFPPSGEEVWNPDLGWQPLPIHTRPVPIDLILDPDSDCPVYNEEADRVFASPEMQAIDAENEWLYEYLTNYTGTLVDDIIQTGYIYDTLMIEKLYNLSIPAWVDPVYDQMHNLSDLGFIWRYKTPLEQRLKGGGIVKRILENSYRKSVGASSYSLHLFSSHDTLVSAVLNGLNVFNGIAPPYASAIFFDLHEPLPGHFALQVSYYNDTSREPYVYAIPGCADLCPLDTFSLLVNDLLPVDLFRECNVTIDTLAHIYTLY